MPDIQSGRRFDERALVNLVNPDFPSPALVEMLGKLGFDAVFLDCEHGFASLERIQEMARTARASGMVALVRPELSHPAILTRYLEAGADGLILPHVEATSEVRAAVDVVRRAFPHDHERRYVAVIVESPLGVRNLDGIVAVEGLTAVLFGAVDLAADMGFAGQPRHPDVTAAIAAAVPLVHRAGLMAGFAAGFPELERLPGGGRCIAVVHADQLLKKGCQDHLRSLA